MGRSYIPNGTSYECFQILTGEPIELKLQGRPKSRLEEDIRMDYSEVTVCTRN
jgi:hypothetical protein